jgi:lycopene cyclase domain-containing protein
VAREDYREHVYRHGILLVPVTISGFLLFILFNYILTSLPVVIYSPSAVPGVRFMTIPLEDFFYNFTMISVYPAFYLWAKDNPGTLKNFRIPRG